MSCGALSRSTKSAIRVGALALAVLMPSIAAAGSIPEILRQAALDNGLIPVEETRLEADRELVNLGKQFFESKNLSLNGNISCKDCHLKQFSSADGLPNAIGIDGVGQGAERALSGGAIVPRNTLPLWGRGAIGFDMFFWDGKVDFTDGQRMSQFGDRPPSGDPLITAVHLPPVEIREMLVEDKVVFRSKREDVDSAKDLYETIMARLKTEEHSLVSRLAKKMSTSLDSLQMIQVATAIAHFIRTEFELKTTRFHQYVFEEGSLSDQELRGGLVFYGKGKCATCHSGPYLTDFSFHAIAFPQLGFGKNGFGIDYGRYNITHDPADLYRFRTPPLFNVEKTAPYGHSGSVATLRDAIQYHFDPLALAGVATMSPLDRHEYYKRLAVAGDDLLRIGFLSEEDVDALIVFLHTLSF